MWEEIFNLIPGTVNTMQGTAVASHSTTMTTPMTNRASFEDMLVEEANFTPSHQPRHVKYVDTMKGAFTSNPHKQQEEVALPPRPVSESHLEETGLHTAAGEFRKMWEPKINKVKGGYISSAGLVFQSWLDIHVNVQDRRLTQGQAIQLVKDFTAEHVWDEVEFYMGMVTEDQSFKGLIQHLLDAFQSCRTLSELITNFYGQSQKAWETQDTFTDDLKVLARKK